MKGVSYLSSPARPAEKLSTSQPYFCTSVLAIQIIQAPLFTRRNVGVPSRGNCGPASHTGLNMGCTPQLGCNHYEVFQKGCLYIYPHCILVVETPVVSAMM